MERERNGKEVLKDIKEIPQNCLCNFTYNELKLAIKEAKKEVFDDIEEFFNRDDDMASWDDYDDYLKLKKRHLSTLQKSKAT